MQVNSVTLIGNLTRDPELKALPSGTKVCNFSLATNRTWKDRDGKKQEAVEYHNVIAFEKRAEVIAQYMKKGSSIYVHGRLQTRSWDKDGVKHYRTEIVVEDFQFGSKGSSAPAKTAEEQAVDDAFEGTGGALEYPEEDISPQDIPF